MEIRVLSRGVSLTDVQNEFVERRIQFALGRFSSQVRAVQVTLSDINGPRGGNDVLCRIKVLLKRSGDIVVGDTDGSVEAVVAGVADRAARSLARLLERQRDHQGISMSGQTTSSHSHGDG